MYRTILDATPSTQLDIKQYLIKNNNFLIVIGHSISKIKSVCLLIRLRVSISTDDLIVIREQERASGGFRACISWLYFPKTV